MNRFKRILLLVVPFVVFTIVFLYDVVRMTVDLDIPKLLFFRELLLASAFFLLYLYQEKRSQGLQNVPKEMGNVLLFLLGLDLFVGIGHFFRGSASFDPEASAIKQSALSVLWMTIVAVAFGCMALRLLKFYKELILSKRRKKARRNFILYLIVLLCACFARYRDIGEAVGLINSLLMPILIILMVINSFRQQWIVYLSKREKMYTLVYSALLFLFLAGNAFYLSRDGESGNVVAIFSAPLQRFAEWNYLFGMIYFGISFASTLFHLPTAEVFERKQSELNSLHSLSRLVTQVFDFGELMGTVTQMAVEASGAEGSWLELVEENSSQEDPRTTVTARRHISEADIALFMPLREPAFQKKLFETRKSVLIENIRKDRRFKHVKERDLPRRAVLSIPLLSHDHCIGVLYIVKNASDGFDQDDIEVLTTFTDNVSLAIDNSKLISKSIERERLHQEMMVAQQMQRRLFPQRMPEIPEGEFAAVSDPSTEVGGDYYDFVDLPGRRIGIVIGDVAGKGVSAAFYMAEVKGIFLTLSKLCRTPKEFLVRANAALLESMEKKAFVSLEYAVLNVDDGSIVIARAGHCPTIYISQDVAQIVQQKGMGLGLTGAEVFEPSIEEREILLKKDDICIFYTDGITEARNPEGEEFGTERLTDLCMQSRSRSAEEMKETILAAVRTFMGASTYKDDITLVVLKWKGTADEEGKMK
jgi:serine phosphatase RsbU (regulator of sigma subunit)